MRKKILALAVILALVVGATNVAMAANTNGSIEFESKGVIINEPPEETIDPGGTDYNKFFFANNVKKNLYFGQHDLTVYGVFDSANTDQTTPVGMYTGAEVINQTATATSISVEISTFKIDGTGPETLAGATFKLIKYDVIAEGAGVGVDPGFVMPAQVSLTPGGAGGTAISVDSGRMVRAAWSGELTTLAGTADTGEAQAMLTWTAATTP